MTYTLIIILDFLSDSSNIHAISKSGPVVLSLDNGFEKAFLLFFDLTLIVYLLYKMYRRVETKVNRIYYWNCHSSSARPVECQIVITQLGSELEVSCVVAIYLLYTTGFKFHWTCGLGANWFISLFLNVLFLQQFVLQRECLHYLPVPHPYTSIACYLVLVSWRLLRCGG